MPPAKDAAPPVEATGMAYLFLTLTTLSWAGNAILAQLAKGEISPMLLVTIRWLGAFVVLLVIANGPVRKDWPVLRRHLVFVCAMGATGFAMFNALFYVASHSTTAINIGIIQGSLPVFIILGAYAAHSTKATPLQIAGVLTTLVGVSIVAIGGDLARIASLSLRQGDLLMVTACAVYAVYTVLLPKRPKVSALGFFTVMCGAAFAASLPMVAIEASLGALQWPTATGWVIAAVVTLFPALLAQICFIRGVALIGPGRAGVFINLVPIFAAVMAVLFLKERFEPHHGLALAMVLSGIWMSERGKADASGA